MISTKAEKVTGRAIGQFAKRHELEVQGTKARVESAQLGYAIANKGHRVALYQETADLLMAEIRIRGITLVTVRSDKDGEVETRTPRINEPLIRSLHRVLRAVAEEMGEIPRWQAPDEGKGYGKPGDLEGQLAGGGRPAIIYRNVPESLGVGARPGEPGYLGA